MKKIMILVLIAGVLSSFRDSKEIGPVPDNGRVLPGYKLKSSAIVFNDYNLWVITNSEVFDKLFIPETETAARPDFNEEMVLAAKVETPANTYNIRFKKTEVRKKDLNVYFTVQKEGPGQDGAGPVSLITFSRNPTVRKVNFYHDNLLVRSIPVVAVY
jgi:hypothetical protein